MTRQVQNFVSDEVSANSVTLFNKYCAHKATEERSSEHTAGILPANELYELAAEKVGVGWALT